MAKEYAQLINGTKVNAVGLLISTLTGFFIIPIQIFYLGIDLFGLIVISNIFAITGLISIIDMGIPGALTQRVAYLRKNEEVFEIEKLYSSSALLFFLIGLLTGALFFYFSPAIGGFFAKDIGYDNSKFIMALQAIFLSYIWQFPLLILRAQMLGFAMFGKHQMIIITTEITRFIVILGLLRFGYGFESVIFCNAFLPLLELAAFILLSPTKFRFVNFKQAQISIKNIWRMSKLLFIGRISGSIFNNSDKLIASIFLTPAAVGLIDIFTKMPLLLNKLLSLAVSTVIPVLSGLTWPKDKSIVKNIYHVGFKTYFTILSLPILQLAYFTPQVLQLWAGQDDTDLALAMQLMLLWTLIVPLTFGGNFLIGLDRYVGSLTKARVSMALLKLVSLIMLVTATGFYAVPISYLASSLAIFYLLFIFRKAMNISLYNQLKDYIKIIFFSGAPIIMYHYLFSELHKSDLLTLVISVFLIFVFQLICICFGICTSDERRKIFDVVSSRVGKVTG